MSIFSNFWSKISSLFTKTTSTLKIIKEGVAYVTPIVNTIATLAGDDSETAKVLAVISADLTKVTSLSGNLSNISSIETLLEAIKDNIGTILALAAIKNSTKVTQITAAVNLIVSEIEVVLSQISAS